jgi:hypothetical protein
MRARPKILLCSTYEEAIRYFQDFREYIVGIISDIEFPCTGQLDPMAGIRFAREVRTMNDSLPILLQSTKSETGKLAREMNAGFLLKNSPTLLQELRSFLVENFGFGDFVFRDMKGREVYRAADMKALEEAIAVVPAESIRFHAERHHFSTWLKARTEFALARKLRAMLAEDYPDIPALRKDLIATIQEFRRRRAQGIIEDFDPATFDAHSSLARIGGGSIGGKARGLAFACALLKKYDIERHFPEVTISVPPAVIIGTDYFDQFLDENHLRELALQTDSEDEIIHQFLIARLPEELELDLRVFLGSITWPLAVRSSSLLEDSHYQPFSGIYKTFMLPNNHPDLTVRLEHLLSAIRRVYASTFSRLAKAYIQATPYRLEEEKMAVLIQKATGSAYGNRFYPSFSGVGQSWNFYPTSPMTREDGIVALALGFGKTVVEGGSAVRFCPKYPEHGIPYSRVDDLLDYSQKQFHVLSLEPTADPHVVPELDVCELDAAYEDDTLYAVGSVYSPENDAIYDGISRPGIRFVSFAPILKHRLIPLPEILELLLKLGGDGMNLPIEMEFAVNLSTPPFQPKEFSFLQIRPLGLAEHQEGEVIESVEAEQTICRSSQVLGNGRLSNLQDIVMVDPDRFDRARTREVAREVDMYNAELAGANRHYILIGIGRWGSLDPWLGIPVTWDMISRAKVIVEGGFSDIRVTPSQGAHFFQNLTTFSIGYFTINADGPSDFLDWRWLMAQSPESERRFTRHLRFPNPLVVQMNGQKHEGIIRKP